MPRTETANKRIREERRIHILDSAVSVFARKGLTATRIVEIAEAGNISLGLIYHYFHSKEEIFTALVEHAMDNSTNAIQMIFDHPGKPLEKLHLFLQHSISSVWARPEHSLLIQHAFTSTATPQQTRAYLHQQASTTRQGIQQLIVQGQARGEIINRDPAELTLLLLACVQGLTNSALFLAPSGVPHPDPTTILRMLQP